MALSYYQREPQNETDIIDLAMKRTVDHTLVHYQVEFVNRKNEKQGMALVEINLPSCVQVDLNQLEDLKRGNYVDYYELRNSNSQLVFYFRGLKGYQKRTFSFGFVKHFKFQECETRSHRAFLYYSDKSSVYSLD